MRNKKSNRISSVFFIAFAFSILLFLLFTYLFAFHTELPVCASKTINPSVFGQYGDVVGGIVGTVITFLSVYLIYETFKSQKEELEATQDALYDQKNDTSFFSMLTTLREIVTGMEGTVAMEDIAYGSKEITLKGRDYLNSAVKELRKTFAYDELTDALMLDVNTGNLHEYSEKRAGVFNEHGNEAFERIPRPYPSIPIESTRDEIVNGCSEFYYKHEHNLDHYFRFIETIIAFIQGIKCGEDKKRYFQTLSAQLSQGEMVLLFYYSLSCKNNFKETIDEWRLLESIRSKKSLVSNWHHWHFTNTDFRFLSEAEIKQKKQYRKMFR